MRTWVIGDSIVNWAGVEKVQIEGGGEVFWNGLRGGRVAGVTNRLKRYLDHRPFPTTIILHLGTNDIFTDKSILVRQRVVENLTGIRELLPNTRLIWSDIIPRLYYYGEITPGAGKRTSRNINAEAHRVLSQLGNTGVISHATVLHPAKFRLFRHDGLHLSDEGNIVFRKNLSDALVYFNQNSYATAFPPR